MGFSWFLSFLLLAKFLIAMASILSFRKFCYVEPVKCSSFNFGSFETLKADNNEQFEAPKVEKKVEKDVDVDSVTEILLDKQNKKKRPNKRGNKEWRCVDCCCWIIGYTCTTWWLLLFLYHSLPANLPGLRVAEPPRTRLKREGLIAHHQLFLCPALSPAALSFGKGSLAQKGFSGSGFGVVASVKSSRGLCVG